MPKNLFSLSSYLFDLPQELIAQYPCNPRDSSRLMLIEKKSGSISEMVFRDLVDFLNPEDSLVLNNTKVLPARLFGKRKGGGVSEILLVRKEVEENVWTAMIKPGRKTPPGSIITFAPELSCEILQVLNDGLRKIKFHAHGDLSTHLTHYGRVPLPVYIRNGEDEQSDKENYQTLYAENAGAIAAPTAGLHFTQNVLNALNQKGIQISKITLHVGLGTFKAVQSEDIRGHQMHTEQAFIDPKVSENLNRRSKGRQICVGTTCCRALESAADEKGMIIPGSYDTSIFIYPGYQFKYVNSLLTNFHIPGSTLLMLVSAFAGYELMMEAYAKAIEKKFRFFSYGDAMLII